MERENNFPKIKVVSKNNTYVFYFNDEELWVRNYSIEQYNGETAKVTISFDANIEFNEK